MASNLLPIRQALEQANDCHNETWQWWVYTSKSEKLVLCGYHPDFDRTGFLVFKHLRHVRIPQLIYGAHMRVEAPTSNGEPARSAEGEEREFYDIRITTPEQEYCVSCSEVVFYPFI